MNLCSQCYDAIIFKSNTPDLCVLCEAHHIRNAAKDDDKSAYTIAEIASWIQSGTKPHRYRRAWKVA